MNANCIAMWVTLQHNAGWGDPRLYVCQAPNAFICVSSSVSILGPFWVHFGSILGPFWVHFRSILGPFWVHFGSILGPFWVHFGSISLDKNRYSDKNQCLDKNTL